MSFLRRALLLLPIVLAAPGAWAQTQAFNYFNPLNSSADGFHLFGVSVYGAYYTSGTPFGLDTTNLNPNLSSSGVTALGASASLGWSKSTQRGTVSVIYSPSYVASPQHTEYDEFSQRAAFNWSQRIGNSWSFGFTASGMLANFEQLLFSPSALGSAAASSATFDDLASSTFTGKTSNPQLGPVLASSQLASAPEQSFLYGNRLFTATSSISLGYSPHGRSSVQISISGARTQNYQDNLSNSTVSASGIPAVPRSTSADVSVSYSYSISPRTQFALTGSSMRIWSSYTNGYTTQGSVSLGRTLSPHWFVQVHAGVGGIIYSHTQFSQPSTPQGLGGVSLGYKIQSHTFLASYDRGIGDSYGLGAATTGSASGAWNWRRPGSAWSLSSGFGYQGLSGSVFRNTKSWHASAGVARALGRQFFVSLQYSYLQFPSNLAAIGSTVQESGVVVSGTWTPSHYR
jgi:hypothetical protein